MEWVTALLAVGCLFIAAQVVVDYLRYRRAMEPRLETARSAGEQLRHRMEAARRELAERRKEGDLARPEPEDGPGDPPGGQVRGGQERMASARADGQGAPPGLFA